MAGDIMRYNYSSKHYLFGFILFFSVSLSGAIALKNALNVIPIIYFGYVIICCFMLFGYWNEYYRFKDKYIVIYKEGLIISDRNQVIYIGNDEIDCIIEANHHQRLKIHNIVHVFLKDGRYFYFTNQISKYLFFKIDLQAIYHEKFYIRESLFSDEQLVTKENLMNDR